jgi:hypothetical protein
MTNKPEKRWYVRAHVAGQPRQVWLFDDRTATCMSVTNPKAGAGTHFEAEPSEDIWDCIRRQTRWLDPDVTEGQFYLMALGPAEFYPRIARPIALASEPMLWSPSITKEKVDAQLPAIDGANAMLDIELDRAIPCHDIGRLFHHRSIWTRLFTGHLDDCHLEDSRLLLGREDVCWKCAPVAGLRLLAVDVGGIASAVPASGSAPSAARPGPDVLRRKRHPERCATEIRRKSRRRIVRADECGRFATMALGCRGSKLR